MENWETSGNHSRNSTGLECAMIITLVNAYNEIAFVYSRYIWKHSMFTNLKPSRCLIFIIKA